MRELGPVGAARSLAVMSACRLLPSALEARTRDGLSEALEKHRGPSIVIAGTLDWHYPYRQRAHHLAKALAGHGVATIYVSPGRGRDPVLTFAHIAERLYLTPHLAAAVAAVRQPCVYVASTNVRMLATALALARARDGQLLYDYVDALDGSISNGPITQEFSSLHAQILHDEESAFVVATADRLFADVAAARRTRLALVTNGADRDHFAAPPAIMPRVGPLSAARASGRPIIGYFGLLARWLDYGLVVATARLRPGCTFVLMGPDFDGSAPPQDQLPVNVLILPPVPYAELPAHAAAFDVAMVPFAINDITLATSPIKLFEYMALGKPIVSTPLPESAKYGCVLLAQTPQDTAAAIDRALQLRFDDAYRAGLAAEAERNSWRSKARQIADALHFGPGPDGRSP